MENIFISFTVEVPCDKQTSNILRDAEDGNKEYYNSLSPPPPVDNPSHFSSAPLSPPLRIPLVRCQPFEFLEFSISFTSPCAKFYSCLFTIGFQIRERSVDYADCTMPQ